MDINDILMHLGEEREKYFQAVSPPIIQSSNFVFDSIEAFRLAIQDEQSNHIYTRGNNPTVAILRKKLAALEAAEDALITSSGAAAVAIAVLANVKSGDHAVVVNHPYSWTYKLFTQLLHKFGVETSFVDGTSTEAIEQAIQANSSLLFLESPNSITFELQDLDACALLARKHGMVSIIDNSYSTPLLQKLIQHGIDIVIHSATKYINGHSDVVAGVVCSHKVMIEKIFKHEYMTLGAIISPHDAALMIRGLRTLGIRLERITATTQKLLAYLESEPLVKELIYPYGPRNKQYLLAEKQMKGGSGLFSIILDVPNKEKVYQFVKSLKRFLIAVSWGGHESLIMPFISFHDIPGQPDHYIDWRLIRFSVGLEDADYLIEDLKQAFMVIQ